MASNKKEREPKFSLDDCIILCNLMGEDCGVAFLHGLSNHDLMRHRFTEVNPTRPQPVFEVLRPHYTTTSTYRYLDPTIPQPALTGAKTLLYPNQHLQVSLQLSRQLPTRGDVISRAEEKEDNA
ncbi:hypothetical protein DPMN_095317 [Dreissena polymorpha]|uniref:Uncharacterized protein n=1 Tax=Dreissena polymorpha TaxID=45954 RepID=A0A9D4R3P5_DREPO|nr:hypothetical protein DPMN_095317 [Dreissena polymorpha]